ncbi:MAG TPA: MaoC family dehydratase N-terminal domain-containing protein [Dehalococcoidia bacterium]
MSDERSLISDEVRALIGSEAAPRTFLIDPVVGRRLAEALDEDPEAVAAAEFAPSYYFSAYESFIPPTGIAGELASGVLAGDEWEQYRPLRWGERIESRGRIADIYERFGGSHGQTLYLRYEWRFTDERGELVAVSRRVFARYATGDRAGEEAP